MVQQVRFRLRVHPSDTSPPSTRTRFAISGSMTANAVARQYPRTDALFRRLKIDREAEGYETVEELAWRRGVDLSAFMEELQRATE